MSAGDRLVRVASAALPGVALAIAGVILLPFNVLAPIMLGLTAWTCASVPIGVLVGHCALGEE